MLAWLHEDMLGIDSNIMVHRLDINPMFKPVKQKYWAFNVVRYMVINAKVDKLFKASFINES